MTPDKTTTRLIDLIDQSGLSYGDLSERTGIPKSAIHRYATGETSKIPADRAEVLARELGSTAMCILGLNESSNAKTTTDNRIVLTIPAPKNRSDRARLNGVVRIGEEAELALMELCGKTGMSMKSVASSLIVQAARICEIRRET